MDRFFPTYVSAIHLPKKTREALDESMKMEEDNTVIGYDSGASLVRSLRADK